MLLIDGSRGEGGGQVLRSALSLSLVTGTPFRIVRIRARRPRPGLLRQHLAAVRAAAAVGGAQVEGAELRSRELAFTPGTVAAGDFAFAVGSAGSATLVLQTVLPALLAAAGPSTVTIEGGTHNPMAPPWDFLERAFLPLVARLGPAVDARLERPGFHPAGGGRVRARVAPAPLARLELRERGALRGRRVTATVSALPRSIAEREVAAALAALRWERGCGRVEEVPDPVGPGNAVVIDVEAEHVTEVFTGFGEKGVRAELVAGRAAREAAAYLEAGVPVGPHLADQLLVPLAVGAGGAFLTMEPTRHASTSADVIADFLGVRPRVERVAEAAWLVEVAPARAPAAR